MRRPNSGIWTLSFAKLGVFIERLSHIHYNPFSGVDFVKYLYEREEIQLVGLLSNGCVGLACGPGTGATDIDSQTRAIFLHAVRAYGCWR